MISALTRLAMLSLALLSIGAAPAAKVIPLPGDPDEALIIPAGSSVQFRGFDKYGRAHFGGRFVLTGSFTYGCAVDCDGPARDAFFRFDVVPDPNVAARLPHWKVHHNDIKIVVSREAPLVRKITTQRQRADIKSQRIPDIQGRITIMVDEFETGLDCDSANFSARFVALPKAPKFAKAEFNGNYGCG
jgi:hypothetical protein